MVVLKEEIKDFLRYCLLRKELDVKTVKAYRIDLSQFELFIDEAAGGVVNKESVNKYLEYIHEKYKQKTVKRKTASIKVFYNYLLSEEIISENPIKAVKFKFKEDIVLPKTIPCEVIEQLLSSLYTEYRGSDEGNKKKKILRDIAVIEFMFATGIRISELCSLKYEEFNLNNATLCIKGKGGKERYLQIGNESVLAIMKKYYLEFHEQINEHGYFFVNQRGGKLSDQSARRMIKARVKHAAIDMKITPHMFRHAFATLLLEEEVDIRYIQKMLGHASIVTTQIYTYVTSEKQKEILKTKHPRNKMNMESL
ncbi:MAG: tyrosine-type recombinase/integrase [Eubacteriales bacterium]